MDSRIRLLRPLAFRIVAVLALVAQLVVGFGAPLAEAKAGVGAGAHIEATGSGHHYVHNEDRCAACVMHHIFASVPRARADDALALEHQLVAAAAPQRVFLPRRHSPDASRPPPPPVQVA